MLTMNSDVGNPINVDFQECDDNFRLNNLSLVVVVFLDFLS